ncbi:MAG: hypothetical protein AAGG72_01660 [Pseudomonadota bacterium]
MTAASLNGLRLGNAAGDVPDEKMDQIRELLVGDLVRSMELRVGQLEERVRQLEVDLMRRAEALDMRLEALSGEVTGERRAAFSELSRCIGDLQNRVKQISGQ